MVTSQCGHVCPENEPNRRYREATVALATDGEHSSSSDMTASPCTLCLPFYLSCCILTCGTHWFCQPYSLEQYLTLPVASHQSVVSPTFTVHGSSDHMGPLQPVSPRALARNQVYLCSISCIPHGCLSQGASHAQAHMVISSPSAPTTINGLQTACSTMSPSTLMLSAGISPSHLTPNCVVTSKMSTSY